MRRFAFLLALALALVVGASSPAAAQSVPVSTFAELPGSAPGGTLRWITDGIGSPTVGTPAMGGGANRDLVAYDATDLRWEFVSRAPVGTEPGDLATILAAERLSYDNATSGAAADDVQAALDELFAGGGGGGGGGATDLSLTLTPTTVRVNSSTGVDATIAAASSSSAGIMPAADKAGLDALRLPYDKVISITNRSTACADYTGAFEEYHDGTAAEGQYRVLVVFNLKGAQALRPGVDFYDDGGNWPYKSCFIHHPNAPGAFNGSFPDSLGRLTANAGVVNQTTGIELTVDLEGTIEIDKTAQAKDAALFDIGNGYLAGCVDSNGDDSCDGFYGTLSGMLRIRGAINIEEVVQNETGWTGEGTFSTGKGVSQRFSKEVDNVLALVALNGATYLDAGALTVNTFRLDSTTIQIHDVGSWGLTPPRINSVAGNDGVGAMFYGPVNFTTPAHFFSLKSLDHAILLGDADNGGQMVFFENCDAGTTVPFTCGNPSTGVGFAGTTRGIMIDGANVEGATWSQIVVSQIGEANSIRNVYAETDPSFAGKAIAIGPQYCDGTSGTAPKPKGKIVKEDSECASSGGVALPSPGADPFVKGFLDLHFGYGPNGRAAGGRNILLGEACTTNKQIRLDAFSSLLENPDGSEYEIASAIASSGGCTVVAKAPAKVPPFATYYGLVESHLINSQAVAYRSDLAASLGAAPNVGGLVHWSQLVAVPAGIADGSDDGSSGGATDLTGLTDVTLTTPSTGAVLVKSGTDWIDGPIDLADLDAVVGILADGNVANDITASNYLPLAGGTLTGSVTLSSGQSFTVPTGATVAPSGSGVVVATQYVGGGSLTNAVDLGTAETQGTLLVASGGTGAINHTSGGVLLGSGFGSIRNTGVLSSGQLIIGDGSGDPTIAALSGDVAMTSGGVTSLQTNTVDGNELVATGATPGTYNAPTMTVDGDGRVTSIVQGTNLLVASGTKALATGVINAGACLTDTATATGVASTDVVAWNPNADLSAVVGYRPISGDGLAIYPPIPSSNLITFKVCNPTASPITPGAVTLNYRVTR